MLKLFNHLAWHRGTRRWYLASLLICGGLVAGWNSLATLRAQNARLHGAVERATAAVRSGGVAGNMPASELPALLPGDVSQLLRDMHQFAQRRDLAIAEAKYTPAEQAGDSGLQRIRIDARARGNYAELKNFLADVLAAHEGLSLDGMSIRRGTPADAKVDVQLTLSLYYRKPL
ncbi:GspMb/PilO family protein [Rugamonas sp. A1-17]|nr:GspMb/PilO family protein [Rugamonas sp. A1-17]